MSTIHPRLINQIFENPEFRIDDESDGYIARDIINMNWWNTSGVLIGYKKNRRVSAPFTETQKRIAVQLKEFYYVRRIAIKNDSKFRNEIRAYVQGSLAKIEQLNAYSYLTRANPSQYFHKPDGTMTWVDCTSRATYSAKYVYQNGFIDWDGVCRVKGASAIRWAINRGDCQDLGILEFFADGNNAVKAEVFSQKHEQLTVEQWCERLGVSVIPERISLFDRIKHVRTDPYKNHESSLVERGEARGVNERLYGFATSMTLDIGCAIHASAASYASSASRASDAGCTNFSGSSWTECKTAITKPDGLIYPDVFRANIFGLAGNWKIDAAVVSRAKLGWFDPFSGHGTSPLYAKKHGIRYLGFDTNAKAFKEYLDLINEELSEMPGPSSEVRLQDSTEFIPELIEQFDLCYTSPPYFNFEEYGGNRGHYEGMSGYDEFHERITIPVFKNVYQYLIPGGTLALQTEKNKTLHKKWETVLLSVGFEMEHTGITGTEKNKYATQAKRDQSLLILRKPEPTT